MVQRYRMSSLYGITSNYFWESAATKIPGKIKSLIFVPRTRLCHELKLSATVNNLYFFKKEWPEKARNVLYNIRLLLFEPGSNPARTRTFSVLPGPYLASGRVRPRPSDRAWDRENLPQWTQVFIGRIYKTLRTVTILHSMNCLDFIMQILNLKTNETGKVRGPFSCQ
jgi:hypothetical protein